MLNLLLSKIRNKKQLKFGQKLYQETMELREKELNNYKDKNFISKDAYADFLDFNDKEKFRLELVAKKYGVNSPLFKYMNGDYIKDVKELYKASTNKVEGVNMVKKPLNIKVVGGVAGGVAVAGGGGVAAYLLTRPGTEVTPPVEEVEETLNIPSFLSSDPYKLVSSNGSVTDEQAKQILKNDSSYYSNFKELINGYNSAEAGDKQIIQNNYANLQSVIENQASEESVFGSKVTELTYGSITSERGANENFFEFVNSTKQESLTNADTLNQQLTDYFAEHYPNTVEFLHSKGCENVTWDGVLSNNETFASYFSTILEARIYFDECEANDYIYLEDIQASPEALQYSDNLGVASECDNCLNTYIDGLDSGTQDTVNSALDSINTTYDTMQARQDDLIQNVIDLQNNTIQNYFDMGGESFGAMMAVGDSAINSKVDGASEAFNYNAGSISNDTGNLTDNNKGVLDTVVDKFGDFSTAIQNTIDNISNNIPEIFAGITLLSSVIAGGVVVKEYLTNKKDTKQKEHTKLTISFSDEITQ